LHCETPSRIRRIHPAGTAVGPVRVSERWRLLPGPTRRAKNIP
jgi:hypothetical protein